MDSTGPVRGMTSRQTENAYPGEVRIHFSHLHNFHPCAQSTPPSPCPSFSSCSVHAEDLPVSSSFLPARNESCFSAPRPESVKSWRSFTQSEAPRCECI